MSNDNIQEYARTAKIEAENKKIREVIDSCKQDEDFLKLPKSQKLYTVCLKLSVSHVWLTARMREIGVEL